jgi:UDP-N-acetylglucosamine 2-epimerase
LVVAIILGTRPQIIKSAPVSEALEKAGVMCEIINTGQHYDYEMNREFFSELKLPDPAADLGVGKGTPSQQVAQIIEGLGKRFDDGAPDLAIVPGDTNSALAAGIACSKSGVPIAHLESGCRSNDLRMAEEVNRRLLDHASQVLLCPTQSCVNNLRSEQVLADLVKNVGDTMYDSLLRHTSSIERIDVSKKYVMEPGSYAFMTIHRAEVVDERRALTEVMAGVSSLGTDVLFSVHPRTKERIREFGISVGPRVMMVGPLPYLDALALVKNSEYVITDSGGLQKEAFWLGKPSLITRETTEWTEIIKAGAAFLVGTKREGMARGARKVARVGRKNFRDSTKIFGNGKASQRVAQVVSDFLSSTKR